MQCDVQGMDVVPLQSSGARTSAHNHMFIVVDEMCLRQAKKDLLARISRFTRQTILLRVTTHSVLILNFFRLHAINVLKYCGKMQHVFGRFGIDATPLYMYYIYIYIRSFVCFSLFLFALRLPSSYRGHHLSRCKRAVRHAQFGIACVVCQAWLGTRGREFEKERGREKETSMSSCWIERQSESNLQMYRKERCATEEECACMYMYESVKSSVSARL